MNKQEKYRILIFYNYICTFDWILVIDGDSPSPLLQYVCKHCVVYLPYNEQIKEIRNVVYIADAEKQIIFVGFIRSINWYPVKEIKLTYD